MNRARRGASALIVALSMGVLCGFVALVVDLGMARVAQAQLQAATDAGALGGVRLLDGTAAGMAAARAAAFEVAGANDALSEPVVVADDGVVLGRWDSAAGVFEPDSDPEDVDAVRVRAQRDDLSTWFAVVMGRDRLATAAESVAVRGRDLGASRVPWYLPFALPDCEIEAHGTEGLVDLTFVLNPADADTVGWGAVGTTASAAWVRSHVDAILACMHEWEETGVVEEACAMAGTGDSVDLGTGNQASSLHYLSDALERGIAWDPTRWGPLPDQHPESTVPAEVYGRVLEGPIPVFDATADYCSSAAGWTETLPIRGFVWATIFDVRWKGSAAEQNVWVRVDTAHVYDVGEWYGGESWGVTYAGPPVLVW